MNQEQQPSQLETIAKKAAIDILFRGKKQVKLDINAESNHGSEFPHPYIMDIIYDSSTTGIPQPEYIKGGAQGSSRRLVMDRYIKSITDELELMGLTPLEIKGTHLFSPTSLIMPFSKLEIRHTQYGIAGVQRILEKTHEDLMDQSETYKTVYRESLERFKGNKNKIRFNLKELAKVAGEAIPGCSDPEGFIYDSVLAEKRAQKK